MRRLSWLPICYAAVVITPCAIVSVRRQMGLVGSPFGEWAMLIDGIVFCCAITLVFWSIVVYYYNGDQAYKERQVSGYKAKDPYGQMRLLPKQKPKSLWVLGGWAHLKQYRFEDPDFQHVILIEPLEMYHVEPGNNENEAVVQTSQHRYSRVKYYTHPGFPIEVLLWDGIAQDKRTEFIKQHLGHIL